MKVPVLIVCIAASTFAKAQGSNYWYAPYSTGGFFLPGSVIAYNGDSGVYFINPALLAQSAKGTIAVNAVLYQLQSIKIKDGTGMGRSLNSTSPASVPQMVAGRFHIGKRKFPFAYAIIHNPGVSFNANQRRDEKFQVLDDSYSPGTEYFLGQYIEQNRSSETQFQLSAGHKMATGFYAGLTLEANIFTRYFNSDYNGRALVNPGIADFSMVSNDINYIAGFTNYGARVKLGLSYNKNRHHWGLTFTTPLVNGGGKGNITTDIEMNNLKLTPEINPLSLLANTRQTKLPVKWKVPFSVAAGYLYQYHKGQLYIAAEYFGKINPYDILTPRNEAFIRPDTGAINRYTYELLNLKDARKPVFNFAIGNSFYIRPSLTGYLALRTDFSYYDKTLFKDNSGFVPYTSAWNNYHIQAGVNKKRRTMNFKIGAFFTFSPNGTYDQQVNFDSPNETNILQGDIKSVKAKHYTAGVLLSYIHNL